VPAVRGQHDNKTTQRTLQPENCKADGKDHNRHNKKNTEQEQHKAQEQQKQP
jgi:hypothetical protein